MKAPDKVFVHTGRLGFPCASKINITGNDTEYIRKDALLDWLKECKENPVITDLQKGNIQEIIEKIESL